MKIIDVEIEGIVPLLQHRFPEGEQDKKSKRTAGVPDYSKDAENSLYRNPDGVIYQPASHIEGAMIRAAVNFKIPGKRGKTYKELFKASVFVQPDAIPHKYQEWVVDKRPVVVQRARIIRTRAKFEKWALEFEIQVHDDQIATEVVKEILDEAGRKCGIGDYRPRFGRFMVTEFKAR